MNLLLITPRELPYFFLSQILLVLKVIHTLRNTSFLGITLNQIVFVLKVKHILRNAYVSLACLCPEPSSPLGVVAAGCQLIIESLTEPLAHSPTLSGADPTHYVLEIHSF